MNETEKNLLLMSLAKNVFCGQPESETTNTIIIAIRMIMILDAIMCDMKVFNVICVEVLLHYFVNC